MAFWVGPDPQRRSLEAREHPDIDRRQGGNAKHSFGAVARARCAIGVTLAAARGSPGPAGALPRKGVRVALAVLQRTRTVRGAPWRGTRPPHSRTRRAPRSHTGRGRTPCLRIDVPLARPLRNLCALRVRLPRVPPRLLPLARLLHTLALNGRQRRRAARPDHGQRRPSLLARPRAVRRTPFPFFFATWSQRCKATPTRSPADPS